MPLKHNLNVDFSFSTLGGHISFVFHSFSMIQRALDVPRKGLNFFFGYHYDL
jgi:hypothetical protein